MMKTTNLNNIDIPCLASTMMNSDTTSTLFTSAFFHSTPLMDTLLNSLIGIRSKLNSSLIAKSLLKHLITTLNLNCSFLHLKISLERKRFCNKSTPLCITQYHVLFIAYEEALDMHTRQRNPLQPPEDEQNDLLYTQLISGKLVPTQNILLFP